METLVATVVITAIAVVGTGTVQSALNKGAMVREMGSAKTLIGAYLQSANDNNGKFLPGYDRTVSEFNLPDGTVIAGPPAQRYPYRLASYFNYRMEGTVLVNKNTKQVNAADTYRLSCYPAFGINYIFVGGDISSSGQYTFPGECVTIQSLAS
ncbi:MAG: hypothetical protein ABIP97_09530, partial [Chthoniobacterales bacterium]